MDLGFYDNVAELTISYDTVIPGIGFPIFLVAKYVDVVLDPYS